MEFIDVSQLSFIQDLGPKGLWGQTLSVEKNDLCLDLCALFVNIIITVIYCSICISVKYTANVVNTVKYLSDAINKKYKVLVGLKIGFRFYFFLEKALFIRGREVIVFQA